MGIKNCTVSQDEGELHSSLDIAEEVVLTVAP